MNIMLDLETTGKVAGSCILSIGAVVFPAPEEGRLIRNYSSLYLKVSLDSCHAAGLVSDLSTLDWWGKQSADARHEAFSGEAPLIDALQELTNSIAGIKISPKEPVHMWGNGAAFDLPILEAAYTAVGLDIPWKFYDVRCYRTLKNLPKVPKAGEFKGIKHTAIADAENQARHAAAILAYLAGDDMNSYVRNCTIVARDEEPLFIEKDGELIAKLEAALAARQECAKRFNNRRFWWQKELEIPE